MRQRDIDRWARYFEYRTVDGLSVPAASKKARIDRSTAYRFERGDPSSTGLEAAAELGITEVGGNRVPAPLSPEAKRALDDFGYFRRRYMGRNATPWQEKAAYETLEMLETGDKEYAVINAPPGSGKSTLFTHDIPVWLIVRDRAIRIQISSRTERQAKNYVGRIKRSLERDIPLKATTEEIEAGVAFDADATLAADYGAFKPEDRFEKWRDDEFVVRQLDGVSVDDKEATVSAYGQDSGFLGNRFDFIIWDDLVDRKNTKHASSREELRMWFESDAETRLEPGGLLILQGQRIHSQDLYHSVLGIKNLDGTKKYRHIIYRAHDEDNCTGQHDPDVAEYWPDGCLLDPYRITWAELEQKQHSQPRQYQIMYQQRDNIEGQGLVLNEWLIGEPDPMGWNGPGCYVHDREMGEHPDPIGYGWNFITVDPAPDNYWAIIQWYYDPDTQIRHIVDLWRRRTQPQDFLGYDLDTGEFSGIAEDMVQRATQEGYRISHIVFEANAAQKWFLTQPHIPRWQQTRNCVISPHTTNQNKLDPKYGLESIGDDFRQGKIKIPYASPTSRFKAAFLTNEALLYPEVDTTDVLMSVWFGKVAVNTLYAPDQQGQYAATGIPWRRDVQRGLVRAG